MSIQGKGKYIGKRKIEIDQDLNLSPDTEIFYTIEEVTPMIKEAKEKNDNEHPLLEIAKLAKPAGRSDLSVKYHEILGGLVD